MKKLLISFVLGFLTFSILGGIFAYLVFLPEFAIWYELHPDTVRGTPELISGTTLAVIQLIALVILMDKLKIDTLKGGAIFGIIFSAVLWLIIDLQMISMTNIFSYDYLLKDTLLSGVLGAFGGLVIAWSQKKYS
jgi:hypothetical protein